MFMKFDMPFCVAIQMFHWKLIYFENLSSKVVVAEFEYVFNFEYHIPLSFNPTNCSNTLKQFFGCCRRIARVCLTIFWRLVLKGLSLPTKKEEQTYAQPH